MYCKSLLAVLLLLLCLGPGSKASGQSNRDMVIVIQDTVLDNGTPPATPVNRGQTLSIYQRSGGRLWGYVSVEEAARENHWGWIDASCALPPDQAATHFSKELQKDPKDLTAYLGAQPPS